MVGGAFLLKGFLLNAAEKNYSWNEFLKLFFKIADFEKKLHLVLLDDKINSRIRLNKLGQT